jgi:hypothetical protein
MGQHVAKLFCQIGNDVNDISCFLAILVTHVKVPVYDTGNTVTEFIPL